jgi:acetyltransferase-like isoleucine patch superfamily enzyme
MIVSFLKLVICLQPWALKRRLLHYFFGFQLHPKARIGLSWVYPRSLLMAEGARIGHLNVVIHVGQLSLEQDSSIGRGNWITGIAAEFEGVHYTHRTQRRSMLRIGRSARLTKNHHVDCTDAVSFGAFSIVAGYGSQFLTHSIDVVAGRQECAPISVGDYCLIGTRVVALPGSVIPSNSVVGACSLVNKAFEGRYTLYAGVPAKAIKTLPRESVFFRRKTGYVA